MCRRQESWRTPSSWRTRRRKFAPGQQLATSLATPAASSSAWDFRRSEALACLDADDLRKSKVPVGQQKLLLRCVTRQLGGSANDRDDSGGSAQHPAPTEAIATAPTAGATNNASGSGEDAFVHQLREQLSALQQTAPPNTTAAAGCPPTTTTHGLGHLVCCRGRILMFTCRTSAPLAPTSILLTLSDKVVSTNDEFQLICRAGPKKPRLERLAVNQWSVANIAIMHKLVQDGTLPLSQVFDY